MIENILGFSSDYIIIGLAAIVLILLILTIVNLSQLGKLKKRYAIFMKGKNAKSLEDTLVYRLEQLDDLIKNNAANERNIQSILRQLQFVFQKFHVLKYDALEEMGGKLSYVLCMLNNNNDGYVINVVHTREGCYNYIKEIIDGHSVIGLSPEEEQALLEALKTK